MTRLLLGSAALVASLAAFAPPAIAQATQRYVEVYGDDACPTGSDSEIIVCARKPESERYRIPETLRRSTMRNAEPTNARGVAAMDAGQSGAGNTGTGSCSTAGSGGANGCTVE